MVYQRYIFGQALRIGLVITVMLTAVLWLSQSLRLLEFVVGGNKGAFRLFLNLLIVTLPKLLEVILPTALALGIVFAYRRMAEDSELIVMRAGGLSQLRLAKPIVVLALVITVVMFALGGWATPYANARGERLKALLKSDYAGMLLRAGVFTSLDAKTTLYITAQQSPVDLTGVLLHQHRRGQQDVTVTAERGVLKLDEAVPQITVYNGARQEVNPQTGAAETLQFQRYTVTLPDLTEPSVDAKRLPDPDTLQFPQLLAQRSAYEGEAKPQKKWRSELHGRISRALSVITLSFVALALGLGRRFDRRGQVAPVIPALLGILVLQGILFGLINLAAKGGANPLFLYSFLVLTSVAAGRIFIMRGRRL